MFASLAAAAARGRRTAPRRSAQAPAAAPLPAVDRLRPADAAAAGAAARRAPARSSSSIAPCFEAQGNVSLVEPQTYLYYIQLEAEPPVPERLGAVRRRRPSRCIRDDFKRLWDTNFLDNLSIETPGLHVPERRRSARSSSTTWRSGSASRSSTTSARRRSRRRRSTRS